MAWVNWVGGVWAAVFFGAVAAFVGCSGSSTSNSCLSYCDNLCSSLEACDVEVKDCRSSCESGLTDKACKGQSAPDRLTCAELTETVACADYCSTLCERAPSCGTFDSGACVSGCLEVGPSICNAASVPARTCDQLKPEIRLYEDVGKAGDGDHGFGGPAGPRYGLCFEVDDCDEPLACSRETNTCGPCKTDEDCANPYDARICNAKQECEAVECVSDDDCFLSRACNTETHECVECKTDADCASLLGGACDTKTLKCVECKTDADCSYDFAPSCDVAQQKCVECGEDAHCTSSVRPACDTALRECVECNEDVDCNLNDGPACDRERHECVQCSKDAHCPEDSPRCDTSTRTCQECRTNADCSEERPHCDTGTLSCRDCETNADCADHAKPVCTESGACGDCENDDGCAQGEECDTYFGTCGPPELP